MSRLRRSMVAAAGLAVSAGVLLAGCDADRRAISRDDLPDVGTVADHVVVLGPDGFDPVALSVVVGETVEFRIRGEDTRGLSGGETVETGLLLPGDSSVVVFDDVGTISVSDSTDGRHRLEVRVEDGGPTGTT